MPERDPRGANEAGFPYDANYGQVNPDYFDRADLRIRFLVDKRYCAMHRGLLGYYLPILGLEKTKRQGVIWWPVGKFQVTCGRLATSGTFDLSGLCAGDGESGLSTGCFLP